MILSIFSNQNFIHLLEMFFWMLGAFLIGLFFGQLLARTKSKTTYEIHDFEDLKIEEDNSKIRATKTFERGGKQMVYTAPLKNENNELDFDRIGKSSIENKNNLQKIKGIGISIEEKLNEIGIFSYKQISNLNSDDISRITELIKFFPGRIERDDWVSQANKLLNEDKTN